MDPLSHHVVLVNPCPELLIEVGVLGGLLTRARLALVEVLVGAVGSLETLLPQSVKKTIMVRANSFSYHVRQNSNRSVFASELIFIFLLKAVTSSIRAVTVPNLRKKSGRLRSECAWQMRSDS